MPSVLVPHTQKCKNWQLVLLPKAWAYPGTDPYYPSTYQAWRETWEPVYREVGQKTAREKPLSSDAFTRQDLRLALFFEGQCAALSLFTYTDLSLPHHRHDSYFECWPELAIQSLIREGTHVLICSAFTVTQPFRKRDFGFTTKDLLMGMLVRYFLESGFDVMTGNMRNMKSMNDLSYRWGATSLMKDVPAHGELNDLVGFFQKSVKPKANPEISTLIDELWSNRIAGENQSKAA